MWNANRLATEKPIDSKPTIVARIRHSSVIEAEIGRIMRFCRIAIDIVEAASCPLNVDMTIVE